MSGQLFHIYGPFSVQSFGLCAFIGVVVLMWAAQRHWICKRFLGSERFLDMVGGAVLVGVVGARILHYITEPEEYGSFWDIFKVWEGGLSSLGVVIGCAVYILGYLYYHDIRILPVLDLIGIHTPLLHVFIRFGCFSAGCCGGIPTDLPWATTCKITGALVHPTQLYSALFYGIVFVILYTLSQCPLSRTCSWTLRPGQLMSLYLVFSGLERFLIDFWRGDRVMSYGLELLSVHQWLALGVSAFGLLFLLMCSRSGNTPYERL